jgi:RecA-family ATPase
VTASAKRLLQEVWGKREGFVFLPHKDATDPSYPKGGWHEDAAIPYTGEAPDPQKLSYPEESDIYFCPVVFKEPKRRKENALPTNLLWADLDPIRPTACKLRPSIAWESSPGRFQALWFLDQDIPPDDAAELSKRIAYGDGGDKGGWDLTQVLRVPGTRNFKYPSRPEVKLLWAQRKKYSPDTIRANYSHVNGSAPTLVGENGWPIATESSIQAAILSLPIGVRKQLSASTDGADRSLELQRLARSLIKFGVSSEMTLLLLQRSSWNKFANRPDEHMQLFKQVSSAMESVGTLRTSQTLASAAAANVIELGITPVQPMMVHSWTDFMTIPTHTRWLIEDSWIDQSVGFISGRAKSFKTWIALDLGMSVLSGSPFLGKFPVGRTGPIIFVQEEDPKATIQERMRLISKPKGMLPRATVISDSLIELEFPEYPMHIINLQGFTLKDEFKLQQLRQLIATVRPIMVILDPLIVMLGGTDENKGSDISMLLQECKMWRETYGCSVLIVHHWKKAKTEDGDRGGEHIYGSFAFHAWLESALHVEPIVEAESTKIDTIVVEREFKAAPGSKDLKLKFDIDTKTNFSYAVHDLGATVTALSQKLLDILGETQGWMTTNELVERSGYSRSKVVEDLHTLVRLGKIQVQPGGGRGKSTQYHIK